MRRRHLPVVLTVALCAGTVLLGANPAAAATSTRQTVINSLNASRSASSFSLKGFIDESGSRVNLNLSVSANGRAQGSFTLNGQPIHLIEIPPEIYFSASKKFWVENGVSEAATFANRWVGVPSSNSTFASFSAFLSLKKLATEFFPAPPASSQFKKVKRTSINGHSVIQITGSSKGSSGTLDIASSGTPYVIRLTANEGKAGSASITFSNYNRPVTPSAPKSPLKL